ncbi:type II secretion system minor pseudopilin GspJ [Aliiglaciecola litoralis]|uniref:Type II secretion system protein J n=1 Tax=Aliiglaciecola litoralis TaxID=582857 RepID=A0ABP3WRI3_9ALTE
MSRINRGFTLLEIMIAMAIFTLIGFGSTAVLTEVIESNQISEARFDSLQKLQRAMLVIERDVLQAVPRAIRIEGQNNAIVMRGDKDLFESQADGLGFVRAGWQNPRLMLHRSTLQGVAYRLSEGRLERLYGNYVDNVSGFEPKIRVLLSDVEDFQVNFLVAPDEDPRDQENWEEKYTGTELPAAISITIESKEFGTIHRLFSVGGGAV